MIVALANICFQFSHFSSFINPSPNEDLRKEDKQTKTQDHFCSIFAYDKEGGYETFQVFHLLILLSNILVILLNKEGNLKVIGPDQAMRAVKMVNTLGMQGEINRDELRSG